MLFTNSIVRLGWGKALKQAYIAGNVVTGLGRRSTEVYNNA